MNGTVDKKVLRGLALWYAERARETAHEARQFPEGSYRRGLLEGKAMGFRSAFRALKNEIRVAAAVARFGAVA